MGPLAGVRVVEFGGIGPGPMCAMLLGDLGADVVRLVRPRTKELGVSRPARFDLLRRNQRAIEVVDLKDEAGRATVWRLLECADALIEGFRPGVMERLGFGPNDCLRRNEKLVYGRMTGWGQEGPLAGAAGHDLNYIALSGALHAIGREGQLPTSPLNLIGDFGGGALYLALGIVSALFEARGSDGGQVVDAAMVDGAASLMTVFYGLRAAGLMKPERGTNILDSGAYFYDCYQCSDRRWISVAALEAKFFATLLRAIGIDPDDAPPQSDRERWREGRAVLASRFATRSRDEWCQILEGTEACFAPVLDMDEAPGHAHLKAQGTFVEIDGVHRSAPAPRFSRTTLSVPTPPSAPVDAAELREHWEAAVKRTRAMS